MKTRTGQSSLEFLLILAILLLILLSIIILGRDQIAGISSVKAQSEAKNALSELSSASKEVYLQGEGSRKRVFITLPNEYDYSESGIANQSIKISTGENDYVELFDFDIYGSLPRTPGGQWIWVISEGSRVRIGLSLIQVSTAGINLVMNQEETQQRTFRVTNVHDRSVNVTLTPAWVNNDVQLAANTSFASLDQGEYTDFIISFTSSDSAIGFYSGVIIVDATDGLESDQISLPVNVEVVSKYITLGPPLTITPRSWEEYMETNQTSQEEFTLCTNANTYINQVNFTASVGQPGSWLYNTNSIGPIAEDSCVQKTISINTTGAQPGNYTGFITVNADQIVDYIVITIHINQSEEDGGGYEVTPILFIHKNNELTGNEQRWVDWVETHSSGESLSWEYGLAEDDSVWGGQVSLNDYRIVVMSEYVPYTQLNTKLMDYIGDGGYVVFLGDSVFYGPWQIGYTNYLGYSLYNEDEIEIADNSHYLTQGFTLHSRVQITDTPKPTYSVYADFVEGGGSGLTNPVWQWITFTTRFSLAERDNVIVWGESRPDKFVSNGDLITTRVIDYALINSQIS